MISEATQPLVNSGSASGLMDITSGFIPFYEAFVCDGHGRQRIMVFPKQNLVIVYTSKGYTSDDFFDTFNEVADLISKSCE